MYGWECCRELVGISHTPDAVPVESEEREAEGVMTDIPAVAGALSGDETVEGGEEANVEATDGKP